MEFAKKFLSREFLFAVGLIIIATVAKFQVLTEANFLPVFGAWGGACIGFVGVYTAGKTKVKKATIAANGTK